jgi:AraC-like DNA-binding protein
MYRERASRIGGAAVWSRTVSSAAVHRVLPDGCLDLIWCDGELLVAGPDTRAFVATSRPGTAYAAIRFPPGVGPAVFGVPADPLRDRRVPLSDLWPAALARWARDQVTSAARRGVALEDLALARLAERPPDRMARAVAARLARGQSVSAIAAAVELSDRQLRRRCLTWFGYGPKTLARIMRLQGALARAHAEGDRGAALASAAGYADQAHLAREVKALTGVPLQALVAAGQRRESGPTSKR